VASKYKSEAHRLAHPFQDATSDWLRQNDDALEFLRKKQAQHSRRVREIGVDHARTWLDYCKLNSAPKAVVAQAELNFKVAVKALES